MDEVTEIKTACALEAQLDELLQRMAAPPREFSLEEGERQAILLAISKLAIERPGWRQFLSGIAYKLDGLKLFQDFQDIHGSNHGGQS